MTHIENARKDCNVSENNEEKSIVVRKVDSEADSCSKLTTEQNQRKKVKREELKEPMKPLSPFTLFFRDTVIAIKQENQNTTFKEIVRVVCSMWKILDPVHKDVYIKKHQEAFEKYVDEMRIYQEQLAELEKKEEVEEVEEKEEGKEGEEKLEQSVSPKVVPLVVKIIPVKKTMSATQRKQIVIKQGENQPQTIQLQAKQNIAATPSVTNASNNANGIIDSNSASKSEVTELPDPQVNENNPTQKCTRDECGNHAIINADWEDEYCSNECVVKHCRDVFNTWVQSNLTAQQQNNKT